ncbi:MAG: cyclic nucleotide-binding domain-containing protein, partial [Deltaproteobacteria bacterium]|nr:cyclic nucleotide-binding domain-containing protein [Deltaproteobacteria bacterium]
MSNQTVLLEEAAQLQEKVESEPEDVHARQRYANVLQRLERIPEAVAQLQAVAGHYAAQGRLLQAMAVNLLILELDPKHTETQSALAGLYAQQRESVPIVPKLPVAMVQALHSPSGDQPHAPRGHSPLTLGVGGLLRRATPIPKQARGGILPMVPPPQAEARQVALNVGAMNRIPLFSALERNAFIALLGETELRVTAPGETIVEEGKPGQSMFVIVQGDVEVLRGRGPDGKPLKGGTGALLARLGEGDFFGEMALVANSPRLATVKSVAEAVLLEVDREALEDVIAVHPSVRDVVLAFYRARLLDNLFGQSALFKEFNHDERRKLGDRFRHHSLPRGA